MACFVCRRPSQFLLDPLTRIEFDAVVARFGIPPVHLCVNCFRFLDQQDARRGASEN